MTNTIEDLHTQVMAAIAPAYPLVQPMRGDKLTDDQAAAIVRGNLEHLWDTTAEWEAEAQHASALSLLNEHIDEVLRSWDRAGEEYDHDLREQYEDSPHWHEAYDDIRSRDNSTWLDDLAAETPVLLRIALVDEDHGFDPTSMKPRRLLATCGLPDTKANRATARALLAEVGSHVGMVYVMAGTTVDEVLDLPEDGKVRIVGPHLYVGNPFTGAAMVDGPFDGALHVDRADLRTDADAFGYSWNTICGGTWPSAYAAEIGRAHVWQQGRFTGAVTCEVCGLLPLDQEDIDTMCPGPRDDDKQ